MNDFPWLLNLEDHIWKWFERMRVVDKPGWIRFCEKGALLEPGHNSGLGISSLALKIFIMLGLTSRLNQLELDGWIKHIQSFQVANGRHAGFFEDPAVLDILDRNAGWFRKDMATRRAETRQACAALLSADASPRFPISRLPTTPREVRAFIRRLDWSNPWAAGSHVGHLMFFLGMNSMVFGRQEEADRLIPTVISELDHLQDPDTGSWYSRRPSVELMVNGAMKVLTGYDFLGMTFRYAERLIDLCLTAINDENGCNNADIIYVIHKCSRLTSYRQDEIRRYCRERLRAVERFLKNDGAFSFYETRAQTSYYGVPVSRGLPESDVHGTTLFVWTIVMIGDLLGYTQELGWRLPVT